MALQTKTVSTGSYAWQSWSNSYVITLKLTEESTDAQANTSQVSYLFTISNTDNNRFYDYYYSWDISIGGKVIPIRDFYFDLRNNNTTQTIASGSITVAHNADGTLDMPYNVSIPNVKADNQYGPPAMSLSGTWPLTAIPRASQVHCSSGVIGSQVNITIDKASASMTHTLKYTFGSLSGTIATKTELSSVQWTIPTAFYNQIPSATTGVCTIQCTSYLGSTTLGTTTCQFYANVSETASKPSLSASVTDVNSTTVALTGNANKLVRYYSTAQASATYAAKNGASVANYTMRHNGKNYTTSPTSIAAVENGTFSFSVTDSRGYVTESTLNKTVVPYVKLTCNFGKSPMDVSGNMQLNLSGNCFSGSFGAVNNQITVQYRYRSSSGSYSAWTTISATVSNNAYTAKATLTGLDYRVTYIFQARVTDKLATVKSADYKVRVVPVFDWSETDFNVNGTMKINNTAVADYVVEQGSSGVWVYRKWASGRAECWGSPSVSSGTWPSGGAGRYVQRSVSLMSGLFSAAPQVMMTVSYAGGAIITPATTRVDSATSVYVAFARFCGGTENLTISLTVYAFGRWK